MNNQKRLERLLEGIIVESSIQYVDAREVPGGSDAQTPETHVKGVMVNEGLVPEFGLSVRCSKAFTCIQPTSRDYIESEDFEMATDIKWEFFREQGRDDAIEQIWDDEELMGTLRSHTEMATFNPMLSLD